MIARSLIGNPDILILDEPSTGVDVSSQTEIYSFLKKLNTEKKLTIIAVEHNLDAAITNSTNIFHVADSKGHLWSPDNYIREF